MTKQELEVASILGNHIAVREFLAPLKAQVQSIAVGCEVIFNGQGILVSIDTSGASWKAIWAAAKAVRAALPQTYVVSKPERYSRDVSPLASFSHDSFTVTLR